MLHGLAGSGKAQIAIQYATKWLRTNRFCYLLDASSLANLNVSFKRFAIESGLSSTPHGGEDSVGTRLSEAALLPLSSPQVLRFVSQLTEQWLLIFDNYDLPAKNRFYPRSYFPEGSNGQIIVTSRNKDVEEDIGGKALQVDKMSSDEALQLLLPSGDINVEATNREGIELGKMIATELLGSLPLAIAPGGAFIKQRIRRSRTAIDRLHEYQNLLEQHQAEMLDGRYKGLETLVRQYGKSVITSWDMSFQVVISDCQTAAQLFLFLGFLHHAGIPSELFETAHKFKSKFKAHDRIDLSKAPYHWLGDILSSEN